MAQLIKNMSRLAKALEPKITAILELVAEDVKQEIDEYLQEYYDEYDPAERASFTELYYRRTEQLRNCCKIGKPVVNGTTISTTVYLDINSLKYNTPGADAYKTVVAANSSLHGGWDVSNLQRGQVPWTAISGNTGESFGSGTQIWKEPMQELIDNGKLVAMFKKCAKQRGLNLK